MAESLESKINNTRKEIFAGNFQLLWLNIKPSIELTQKQQKDYDEWSKLATENSFTKKYFFPYKNERQYLIGKKRKELRVKNRLLNQYICEKKGHKEKIKAYTSGGTWVSCTRCDISYTRRRTSSENKKRHDTMSTRFG